MGAVREREGEMVAETVAETQAVMALPLYQQQIHHRSTALAFR
jgi:hypothetical protein